MGVSSGEDSFPSVGFTNMPRNCFRFISLLRLGVGPSARDAPTCIVLIAAAEEEEEEEEEEEGGVDCSILLGRMTALSGYTMSSGGGTGGATSP
jgi:hypothetical protein